MGTSIRVGEPSVPFSGRQGEAKARLVRREGGSVESEKAVERGLDWLARHQRKDGSWSLDHHGQCKGPACPPTRRGRFRRRRHRARPPADARRRAYPGPAGAVPGRDRPRPGLAGLGPAADGRDLHRRRRQRADVQPRDRDDGPLRGLRRDPRREAAGARRRRPSTSSSSSQNPDDGGWRYNPGERATPASSAGRCSPCAARSSPA